MPTSDLLDLPIASTRGGATGERTPAFRGRLLGHEVVVTADRPVPTAALEHLLAQLDEQWDVRRRRSDLARITSCPNVMVAVSPVTLLLVRNVLAAVRLARQAGHDPGACEALLDRRHGRVGLDPTLAAVTARLTLAVATDLLADFCVGSGASTGCVRVGDARREFGDPVPAWLSRAVDDTTRCAWSGRPGGVAAMLPA